MIAEMEAFNAIFQKYDVHVYRPEIIENYNQIFSRDIGFVIDDIFIKANILPDRERELDAIQYIIDKIDTSKVVRPPAEVHIEGGDVMPWNDYIFIGTYKGSDYKNYITARTNMEGVEYIQKLFPNKIVKAFDLVKSKIEPRDNAVDITGVEYLTKVDSLGLGYNIIESEKRLTDWFTYTQIIAEYTDILLVRLPKLINRYDDVLNNKGQLQLQFKGDEEQEYRDKVSMNRALCQDRVDHLEEGTWN